MLSRLVGKRFNHISRAVDMLCLFLGEDYVFVDSHGQEIAVAEYSIHFQTQWRFREGGKILLASEDVYKPYCENLPEDWRYDLTGRPDKFSSVFDVYAKAFIDEMQGAFVSECHLSEADDIVIIFSNGVIFEQFILASRKDEEWRLIDYANKSHIVCYGEDGSISQE